MKMKCCRPFAVAILLALSITLRAGDCGNQDPSGAAAPPKRSPAPSCPPGGQAGGTNFNMLTGGTHRTITDLKLFGGIGDEKLAFTRTSTSRYLGGIPTPLGSGGSWRHSYYWNIYPNGTDPTSGNEIIHVDYPAGNQNDFYKKSAIDLYLTSNSSIQDRIEQLSTDPNQYYLWFIDGKRISFRKVVNETTTIFQAQGFYDRYNNFFASTSIAKIV